MKLIWSCPRCKTDRKYERSEMGRYGCTTWWHQFLMLPNIWPEHERRIVPAMPAPPDVSHKLQPMVGYDVGGMRHVPPPQRKRDD
jgi:hypothetical protein